VTGGAGFIGSHTVGRLLRDGHRVVVLDDFSTGKRENLAQWQDHEGLEIVETDVADGLSAPLEPVVARRGPVHGIIHLAAQTSVIRSVEAPQADARTNYVATIQVLEYARIECRSCASPKVVFTSSSAVYGDAEDLPVSEASPPAPLSPYGIHKRASELGLMYGWRVHGLSTTSLRLFNVYGPRQDPSSPYSGVISIFLDRAYHGEGLVIFGNGEQTRDFVYVGDVAQALTTACLGAEVSGVIANIGTGHAITINELAAQCIAACGANVPVEHRAERSGEIRHSVADITRARQTLGFEPRTTIGEGLRVTADWYRKQV
jgi:UDP-glucose 4-epimerase